MKVIENQSYDLEEVFGVELSDLLDDIASSTGIALETIDTVIIEDLVSEENKEVGYEFKMGDRIVWVVEDGMENELAVSDALSDPISFLRRASDFEINAMIDTDVFQERMIEDTVRSRADLSEEKVQQIVSDSVAELEELGPVTYMRDVLKLTGDAFYQAILDNNLIDLNDLAQIIVTEYGAENLLDIDKEERFLSLVDDYVCFLVY